MRSAPAAIGVAAVFNMNRVKGLQPASQGQLLLVRHPLASSRSVRGF